MKQIIILFTFIFGLLLISRTEVDIGRCLNANGDGKLYNGEPYYNYINYGNHCNAKTNDIVLTVSLVDGNDECVCRWDKIILTDM